MPNICNGYITIKGKKQDIENFCKLFIFEDELDNKKGAYFARSFIHESWADFKKEQLGKSEAGFMVEFAWSAWSCLIDGYPDKKKLNKKEKILNSLEGKETRATLKWACKEYNVDVEITTEEGGMGFEEDIKCNKGKLKYCSKTMKTYKCIKCKNEEQIASSYDLKDYECSECGCSEWKKT